MQHYKKALASILLLLLSLTALTTHAATPSITDYQRVFIPCFTNNHELRIAIRMYYFNKTPYYLAVNPYTFKTEAAPISNFNPRRKLGDAPGYFTMQEIKNTPYVKALDKYTAPPYPMENYGVTQAEKIVNGYFLTIDMCPSTKYFEKDFFQKLVNIADQNHQPVPIGLSITGLWIIGHPAEFNWLLTQQANGKLDITWINHSFSHLYYADVPLQDNFLLAPRTNIPVEILKTEKILLQHGQLPSVFFRFPGLISNEKLVLALNNYGLIPLGADAWLAKGQQPHPGSIILVHGNSNEHEGIELIMPMLQQKYFNLLPLNQLFNY